MKPGGIVMVEVPDCTTSLRLADYCMVWEEHSLYLTPETFAPLLTIGGFEPIRTDVYPLPFENSLVQLARKTGAPGPVRIDPAARAQVGLLARYAEAYEPARRELRATLERVRAERGPIALFGAGHLACAFANFMGVADLIDVRRRRYAPEAGQVPARCAPADPAVGRTRGARESRFACSPCRSTTRTRVIGRNEAFVRAGGIFRSIFRASPRSVFAGPYSEARRAVCRVVASGFTEAYTEREQHDFLEDGRYKPDRDEQRRTQIQGTSRSILPSPGSPLP